VAKSSDLLFRILGKDVSASKALKGVGATAGGVGKKLGGMGVAFAGIGTAAAAAGALIAVDFGKKSVSAFIDAQESQVKFESSLKKNGLGSYTQQVDDLAQSLALKTKFDDDATKSGAAVLANFGLTGDELVRVIPLVQDYAAFTGKDLTTSSKLIGKAFLGNAKALKELGINFKPTGDKARDMATVMQLVNEKVGGFAEKQGKSAAGTAAILSNQFGEVQEQIGSYLVPALTKLGQWIITYVIPAVQKLAAWMGTNLGPVITKLGAWISKVLVPAAKSLADQFMKNVWPILQRVGKEIATNVAPATASLAKLWRETLAPALRDAMPTIKAVIAGVAAFVAGWLVFQSKILGTVIPVFATLVGWVLKVSKYVREAASGMRDAFAGVAAGIYSAFRGAFNGIARLWNSTVGALSFGVPDWVPGLGGKGWDVPNIPMLAKGGIVTRPTLALVGEAGPEAVIPLSRAGGMGGGVTINVAGSVVGGTPEQIARALADYLKRAQGSGRVRTA
jgi:hypothetical protein